MSAERTLQSPQLIALQRALERGEEGALEQFWGKMAEQTTPLVETLEGDDDHSLVTFLWRDHAATAVELVSLLTNPTRYPMKRLPGTDLWFAACRVKNDVRATYQFLPYGPETDPGKPRNILADVRPDPLNPLTFAFFTEEEDSTGVRLVRSILQMPSAEPQPWIETDPAAPKGGVELAHIRSEHLGNERRVWVYKPPDYDPQRIEPYPLLVLFDGWGYMNLIPTPTILDNLQAAGRIPPVAAVMVDSLSSEDRMRELLLHAPFNAFLADELVPWIRERVHVTHDPAQTVVGGVSAGGLASCYAALEHPELFGNVLSQSGAVAWRHAGDAEYEWLARQFAERDKLPLRFHFDVGLLEVNSLRDPGEGPSLLVATRHIRNVLRAKGYQVHYLEVGGGHDYISWQGTLPEGLQALIG